MAKASVVTKQSLTAKGILNLDGDEMMLEVENGEVLSIAELLESYNGKPITIAVSYGEEIV